MDWSYSDSRSPISAYSASRQFGMLPMTKLPPSGSSIQVSTIKVKLHCRGFSLLASIDQTLRFGPETVTSSESENFCTRTPTRVMSRPLGSTMHVEIAPADGESPRSLTFTRTD